MELSLPKECRRRYEPGRVVGVKQKFIHVCVCTHVCVFVEAHAEVFLEGMKGTERGDNGAPWPTSCSVLVPLEDR